MRRTYIIYLFAFFMIGISCQRSAVEYPPKVVVGKHKIVFDRPPSRIPVAHSVDAPLLGNGFTGVAISGHPEKQVYHIARNDFWRLKSSFNQSFPAVLGKLEIDIPELKGASYHVEQDLLNAVTQAVFAKPEYTISVKSYVSAADDVMIIELSLSGKMTVSVNLGLELPGDEELIDNPPFDIVFPDVRASGKDKKGVSWISRGFEEDVDIPTKAACAMRIIGHSSNAITLSQNENIFIVCAFSSNFKSEDCQKAVIEKASSIDTNSLSAIEDAHTQWWADFWSKSVIAISDSLLEHQYYVSNYSMASCSRDKDFPPSIFGTWITKERPHWNGDYHLNYNHMAPYYGLYSSNHIEQADPYNAPVLANMNRGKYYSKKVTGIEEGIILPVGIGPAGIETTRRNALMETHRKNWIEEGSVEDEGLFYGQKSNSSYCVVNMSNQFYHTYDKEYTRRVYPFVKGVATFWENYLTFEDGRYVIYNDAIHEGTVGTKNPILSLGLIPMVMRTAIDMSSELGLDLERHDQWQHIIDHLSEYSYQERNGKKVFRYTEKGTDWWVNNTLGIQHIYPAGQIGLDSDQALLKVAHNTIEVMSRWLDFNGTNSIFPAAVRIGYNPDTILYHLRRFSEHTYPNGFQYDNPHGIENFSTVPNTINMMLCMGHENVLRVFPVWPKNKDASFENLRIEGAFLISSELKNGQVQYIRITSEQGRDCHILNPWKNDEIVIQRESNQTKQSVGNRFTLPTQAGETIVISSRTGRNSQK